MTYAELKRQILNLGFETKDTYDEEPTIMVDAINRAMREITNTFPLIGSHKIAQNPPRNLLGDTNDTAHYDGEQALSYAANGARALYFECSGTGTLTISDNDGTRAITLDGNKAFKEYRSFVRGAVTLTFSGPYAYDVQNVAVYGEVTSGSVADIPAYRKYARYDFKAISPAFIDFMDKIQEADGTYCDIRDFHIEQRSVLVLDGLSKVEYTVFYRKNFTQFSTATADGFLIELDYDKEHLLPLLAAWYVWADDEPAKAAKWRNDYEDYKAGAMRSERSKGTTERFYNDMGW